jgi:hypothetical protein
LQLSAWFLNVSLRCVGMCRMMGPECYKRR